MNKVLCALALLCILLTAAAQAQTNRVLVPIAINSPLAGAYGSMWTSELVARNDSDFAVEVGLLRGCVIPEGCGTLRPPHTTFRPPVLLVSNPNGGFFLSVGLLSAITFELRVQDISRQSATWGTSIPVVQDQDAFTSTARLLDIPVDARFRSTLRVYRFEHLGESSETSVRLRINDMCGIGPIDRDCRTSPFVDTRLTLTKNQRDENDPNIPNSAMIGNLLDAFPQLAAVQPIDLPTLGYFRPATVRIEIEPLTPDLHFWAFVSVTNNETQHVTVITPQ